MSACTYTNTTGSPIQVEYETEEGVESVTVLPGARITFDKDEGNGLDIQQQLVAAGAALESST